jgi:hypothetical protein
MMRLPKPAEGSWTEHYGLNTAPFILVNLADHLERAGRNIWALWPPAWTAIRSS